MYIGVSGLADILGKLWIAMKLNKRTTPSQVPENIYNNRVYYLKYFPAHGAYFKPVRNIIHKTDFMKHVSTLKPNNHIIFTKLI